MESWYFIEFRCREKEKNILKEIESCRIPIILKKTGLKKFHFLLVKIGFFLKVIFYIKRKKEIDIE